MQKRSELLHSLINLDCPLSLILSGLSAFGWDPDIVPVLFTKDHAIAVLQRFLSGSLSEKNVEDWANAIEGREDIQYQETSEEILTALIHELANPILTQALSRNTADEWIKRLSQTG